MSVFKVNNNFTVVLNMDAAKLVPELMYLSQEELLYVILSVDNVDGPYRRQPPEERKLLARRKIWGDVPIDLKDLTEAMEAYHGLIFDLRREIVDVYKEKCLKLQRELLAMDQSFGKIKELEQTITYLTQRVTDIEYTLDVEEKEEFEIKGKKALSTIEVWQRRQRQYKEYKESI
jgi:hypothetical protein